MITGNLKQTTQVNTVSKKFVGFTKVEVKAINPSRSELNDLLGIDSDEDKPIEYLSEDREGNSRVRLSFWLFSEDLNKYFNYSINLINKVRKSKDEIKTQFINCVCNTAWSDTSDNLPSWFTTFTDKQKEKLGDKKFREALQGEEELGILIRAWLNRLDWNDVDTNALVDTSLFFKEDFKTLREQINGNYDTPFVILLGVRTDSEDSSKQYQTIWKNFLPEGFNDYIKKMNFKSDYVRKMYSKFVDDVEGEYGFTSSYELCSAKEYDPDEDASKKIDESITPSNNRY